MHSLPLRAILTRVGPAPPLGTTHALGPTHATPHLLSLFSVEIDRSRERERERERTRVRCFALAVARPRACSPRSTRHGARSDSHSRTTAPSCSAVLFKSPASFPRGERSWPFFSFFFSFSFVSLAFHASIAGRGVDSRAAAAVLIKLGVARVSHVEGGLESWRTRIDPNFPAY